MSGRIMVVRPLFSYLLCLSHLLGDDADRREVKAQTISDLLKRVMVLTDGIVHPLVASAPVRDIEEQRFKARSGCIPFSAQDVRIEWCFGKSRLHLSAGGEGVRSCNRAAFALD